MKLQTIVAMAVAASLSQAALAQVQAPQAAVLSARAPGKGAVAGEVNLSAVVVAVDSATRTLTLKGSREVVDVVVPPEAKNFGDIRVGDAVSVRITRALKLALKPAGSIRSSATQVASAPAPAGAVAGGSAGRQVVIMANVTAVNTNDGYVTLRGPKGDSIDLAAEPSQLKLVKAGDQVEAVYNEAIAITVERTLPTKK